MRRNVRTANMTRIAMHLVIGMANILVVDDLPDAADSFAELLTLFGHDVRVAYCAAQALSDIDQHAPDVVLADLDMPQIDGCELARRIRQRFGSRIRLVAHTGTPRENVVNHVEEAGFDSFVSKTARPLELALAIKGRRGKSEIRGALRDRRRAPRAGRSSRRASDVWMATKTAP